MRILIVTPTIYEYPERIGGAETYIESLAKSLSKINQIQQVGILGFSETKHGRWNNGKVSDIIKKSIPLRNNPFNPLPIFNYFELLKWDVIYIQQFHTWLTFVCIFIAKIFRKKIVMTDHSGGGATYNRRLKIDTQIDLFLATSYLSYNEINLKPKKMIPVYGGVDLDKFVANNLPRDGILFVGRAHRIKGILPFLQTALECCYTGKITLALGVNYDNEEYYFLIDNFVKNNPSLNCVIKKNLTQNELILNYQSHLWTILPSIDEIPHESLGLTVFESLACDTPVAISLFCGAYEFFAKSSYPFVHILSDKSIFINSISKLEPSGARAWAISNSSWDIIAKKIHSEILQLFNFRK